MHKILEADLPEARPIVRGGYLRPIGRRNVLREAASKHDVGEGFDHTKAIDQPRNPDDEALECELDEKDHRADAFAIMRLGFHKVVAPDVIATFRCQPST